MHRLPSVQERRPGVESRLHSTMPRRRSEGSPKHSFLRNSAIAELLALAAEGATKEPGRGDQGSECLNETRGCSRPSHAVHRIELESCRGWRYGFHIAQGIGPGAGLLPFGA